MQDSGAVAWWWLAVVTATVVAAITFTACDRSVAKKAWETAPLAQGPIERVRLDGIPGFDVERIQFRSEATGDMRFCLVLIPRVDHPVDEVLILGHGWMDRPESLLERLGTAPTYLGLLAQGKVRPAILVLPDVRFDSKYRKNSEKYPFPQYLGLIGEETYGIVSRLYSIPPDREKWHVGGFSFGGLLSLDVARRYSARFGSVSVVSAFGDPEWSYWPKEPPAPGYLDDRGRGKHTVVDPGPVPRLLLACGNEDRYYPRMVELHERLLGLALSHVWLTAPGGHNFKYWKSVLESVMVFHLGTEGSHQPKRSTVSRLAPPRARLRSGRLGNSQGRDDPRKGGTPTKWNLMKSGAAHGFQLEARVTVCL